MDVLLLRKGCGFINTQRSMFFKIYQRHAEDLQGQNDLTTNTKM